MNPCLTKLVGGRLRHGRIRALAKPDEIRTTRNCGQKARYEFSVTGKIIFREPQNNGIITLTNQNEIRDLQPQVAAIFEFGALLANGCRHVATRKTDTFRVPSFLLCCLVSGVDSGLYRWQATLS